MGTKKTIWGEGRGKRWTRNKREGEDGELERGGQSDMGMGGR